MTAVSWRVDKISVNLVSGTFRFGGQWTMVYSILDAPPQSLKITLQFVRGTFDCLL